MLKKLACGLILGISVAIVDSVSYKKSIQSISSTNKKIKIK